MDEQPHKSDSKPYFRVAFFITISLGAALVILLLTGLLLGWLTGTKGSTDDKQKETQQRQKEVTQARSQPTQSVIKQNTFPLEGVSLSDTQIEPLSIKRDANGWVLPPNLRYYFEYFIQLRGELPLDKIKQQVKADLAKKHPPELSQYLYDLFLRYLDYREEIDELILYENDLENQEADIEHSDLNPAQKLEGQIEGLQNLNIDEIHDQVETIQAEYFTDPERKALFDESFLARYGDEHTIKPKLDAYESLKKNLTGDALQAARINLFGSEAANRLQQLDQTREAWKNRLIDLQCAELAIEDSTGLSPKDREKQKLALLAQGFNEAEIRRIDALRRNQLLPSAHCD